MKYQYIKVLFSLLAILFTSACGHFPHNYYNGDNLSENSCEEIHTVSVDNYTVTGENILRLNSVMGPRKVVVDGLEETEMALGFSDIYNIKAVYGFYDLEDFLKPEFKKYLNKTIVLKSGEVNKERVLAMIPDLIIAEQCSFIPRSLDSTTFWNTRGIKTYVPINSNSPGKHLFDENIESEFKYIEDFGKLFNNIKLAHLYIRDAQKTLYFFQRKHEKIKQQSVMIIADNHSSLISYDATKLSGCIVKQLGGNIKITKPLIGPETLLENNPDVLFIVCRDGDHGECLKRFCDKLFVHKMKCYKNKRIYSLELESIYAPGIRIKDGIEKIGLGLYPELSEEYWKTQKDTINPSYINWLKYKSMDDL